MERIKSSIVFGVQRAAHQATSSEQSEEPQCFSIGRCVDWVLHKRQVKKAHSEDSRRGARSCTGMEESGDFRIFGTLQCRAMRILTTKFARWKEYESCTVKRIAEELKTKLGEVKSR